MQRTHAFVRLLTGFLDFPLPGCFRLAGFPVQLQLA